MPTARRRAGTRPRAPAAWSGGRRARAIACAYGSAATLTADAGIDAAYSGRVTTTVPLSDPPDRAGVTRRRRLLAPAIDAAIGLLALTAGLVVAAVWLLWRTDAGRLDARTGDAVAAAAAIGATIPTWAAWLALRTVRDRATPGQRLAGLVVVERRRGHRAALLRLAVHPLAMPFWGWLALTALQSGVPWLWLPPALLAAAVAAGGAISLAGLLAAPRRPAIHDLLARTTLASRR
ncbi:MAG: hypothetical protein EXR65_02230 [Dehalococcoidia bacterium]|nr:hypothetical protein [Dehalococcoidia bacterium]